MFETMTVLEGLASVLIGTLVVVLVMAGVVKLDTYLWQRKRVRELDAQHKEFMRMRNTDQAHMDMMMRTGMNPVFAHAAMCTASRSNILTDMPRPEPVVVPEWDGIAVQARGPYRSLAEIHAGHVKENEAAMNRMAENAQTQLDNMLVDHMTAIPAPVLFMQETVEKLKEFTDDRVDET